MVPVYTARFTIFGRVQRDLHQVRDFIDECEGRHLRVHDHLERIVSHGDVLAIIYRHWKMNTSASGWPRHTKLVITEGKPLYVERVTKKKRGKSKAKTLGEVN